ncbi:MAG: ribose 5-phosphate isomerase A [Bacteroidota bacterium]
MTKNELKKLAAQKSIDEIKSGMIIGLGSGSTFQYALEIIAEKIKNGELKDIKGVPSSIETEKRSKELGIPVITLNELIIENLSAISLADGEWRIKKDQMNSTILNSQFSILNSKPSILNSQFSILNSKPSIPNSQFSILNSQFAIDITLDGADEVTVSHPDPDLSGEGSKVKGSKSFHLIKGGGGAHLREKVLFQNSKRTVVIIDDSKLSDSLGSKSLLPVEVIPFAVESEKKFLEWLGAKVSLRLYEDGSDFVTDEGNLILDADFGGIKNLVELNSLLNNRAGIVGHGLFLDAASVVYCASDDGVRVYKS